MVALVQVAAAADTLLVRLLLMEVVVWAALSLGSVGEVRKQMHI